VERVVQEGWVDGEKMCTMGSSYGGYSALMTVIRHPDRYRCAASLMGVTDIALLFNVDSVFGGEELSTSLEEIVGSPSADHAELRRYSPVYNADKIKVPVYLAHGEWDRTVDLDHMIRMKLALALERVPLRLYTIPKTGHGFSSRDDAMRYWLSLREFLAEHIGP
jgi:dipeptidyl aminopeptidase/acylaminoacyl peptidase